MQQKDMLTFVRDQKKRGNIGTKEIAFLQSGVLFKCLKLLMFDMRPETLTSRRDDIIKN